ncbi:MAG: ATP-binding protein, partial [Rhodothermales bacterium]
VSRDRDANGVLVLFHPDTPEPGDEDFRLLDVSAQVAGIAIDRDRFERTARMELKRKVAARTAELEQGNRKLRHEVNERMEAERALRTSESLLKEAERIAHLGSWSWMPGSRALMWSDETYRIFGVDKDSFRPALFHIARQIQPDDRRRVFDLFSMGADGEVRSGEFRIRRPDGEERVVEMEFSSGGDDRSGRVIGVLHDITEQRILEKEILKAGERERKRVGRDLHDGLGQLLTGIGFLSKTLAQTLEAREDDLSGEASEITYLVEDAIDHTRSLSKLLLPVELEENGLEAALQRLRSHVEGVYGISCTLKTGTYRPIQDPEIALHMYRVAQEAVNNAVRHGKPEQVAISLTTKRGKTVLQVVDDGIGLPEGVEQTASGLGLRTMHYRAQTIGAVLSIGRRRSRGTRVVCTLPASAERHAGEIHSTT